MLKPVGVKYRLLDGSMVTEEKLNEKLALGEIEYGVFPSFTPGIGDMVSIVIPNARAGFNENDTNCLEKIIEVINSKNLGDKNKQILKEALNKSPFLKYYLIDMLMPKARYVPINAMHYKIANSNITEIQTLLNILIECGAKYDYILSHPSVTAKELAAYVDYFGDRILNMSVANMPLLMSFFIGKVEAANYLEKAEFMIKKGANVNAKHQTYGTFLHVIIANEIMDYASKCIDLLEKHKPGKFNYASQDTEGKTLLLLATKLSQAGTVKKLMELHKKDIDIGVNVADVQGRTPLLLATALGNKEIVAYLLTMNADVGVVDHQGKGLDWYLNASPETVSDILKSIHVEPERHVSAPHNWLYFNDALARPLFYEKSNEAEKRVLISKKDKHWKLINDVLKEAQKQDKNLYLYLLEQIKPLSSGKNITMLERCIAGQAEVKIIIKTHKEQLLRNYCALGDIKSVKMLVASEVNIEAKDASNRTALHYAVMRQKLVQGIIKEMHSSRPMEECMQGHIEVFSFLMSYHANIHAKNKNGNSPIEILKRDMKENASDEMSLDKKIAQEIVKNLEINHESASLLGAVGLFPTMTEQEQKEWNSTAAFKESDKPCLKPAGSGYGF